MAAPIGTGQFISWDGGCMFIGRAVAQTPMHAHYAIQVGFGSCTGTRFRPSEEEPWTSYDGVLIASRQPHAMDASVVPHHAVMFVDPDTREGRALAERANATGITALSETEIAAARDRLMHAWLHERDRAAVLDACQNAVRELTNGIVPMTVSDDRLSRATAYIRNNISRSITLDEVAREAFLSPSRFRHLFVEQTGMSLRQYILWRRFIRAWELISNGESLSGAAHAAGFADAAHLTRTCRQNFGFAPSMLATTREP